MRWLKKNIWKAGITITCMLLLLALMVWLPVSATSADERTSGLATLVTGTVQATPTEDATVTALNKEKLVQEIQQLKNQNAPDPFGWLQTNASIFLSTLVVVIGGLFGLWRWRMDRRDAHDKELSDRAEERFQAAVTGLGDEREGAKIGAAILLRTFLRPGYEQFYTQTFDLAVANLRLPRTPHPIEDPDGILHPPEDKDTPLPLTTLSQALIVVFREAFPLARNTLIGERKDALQSLDATYIQLDNAFLAGADLKQVWIPQALLRQANLTGANLTKANLSYANLKGAILYEANLKGTILYEANLHGADLKGADLKGAILYGADLRGADLYGADLRGADLFGAFLSEANLSYADLHGAILTGADLTNARSLEGTKLHSIEGLAQEQLATCKAQGAIIDEDPTTSSPQSTTLPSLPSLSNDAQAQSATSTQDDTPPLDTDESSSASSQPDSQS